MRSSPTGRDTGAEGGQWIQWEVWRKNPRRRRSTTGSAPAAAPVCFSRIFEGEAFERLAGTPGEGWRSGPRPGELFADAVILQACTKGQ
jgi:hypothetical protein